MFSGRDGYAGVHDGQAFDTVSASAEVLRGSVDMGNADGEPVAGLALPAFVCLDDDV
ncbi:hypothetical protein [Rhodococcus sp. NPDC057529]|uniref:hypothetical protein n=1 Tax=Rhodococcus sp. NPDC057529 TaxID=3346158 RepID=UPI00366DC347